MTPWWRRAVSQRARTSSRDRALPGHDDGEMPFESETGSAPGTDSEPVGEIESELPVGSEAEPEAEPDQLPQPEPAEEPLLEHTDEPPARARATRVRLRSAIFG